MKHKFRDLKLEEQFNYDSLTEKQRIPVQILTLEIKKNLENTVHMIWNIGKKLVDVRSHLDSCQFSSWLRTEFDWSRSTAYNFISVYEAFPELGCPNVGQLSIPISVLYLLAAPSTPPEIKKHFFDRAMTGEPLNVKTIRESIKHSKTEQFAHSQISSTILESENLTLGNNSMDLTSEIRPAWNYFPLSKNVSSRKISLFWGDTTSPRFHERLPKHSFILAIPNNKWHYDWLSNQSKSYIVISKSNICEILLERLLSAVTSDDRALILPWIPDSQIIELTLKFDTNIYAGDPNLSKCQKLASSLGGSDLQQ